MRGLLSAELARPAVLTVALVILTCALTAPRALPQAPSTSTKPRFAPGELTIDSRPYKPMVEFASERELVELAVVVRDRAGRAVGGLTQGDFVILDKGVPQTITDFSAETSPSRAGAAGSGSTGGVTAPARTVAFFIDDLSTPQFQLARADANARSFIRDGIPPGERVGIFTASGQVEQDFTADAAQLRAAIDEIHAHPTERPCPRVTPYDWYGAAQGDSSRVYISEVERVHAYCDFGDASLETAVDFARTVWPEIEQRDLQILSRMQQASLALQRQPGQRVLLFASSGFVTATLQHEQDALIETALRAGVVINAIDLKTLQAEGAGVDSPPPPSVMLGLREASVTITAATGGQFIENRNDLRHQFEVLSAPPEYEYVMHFSPADPAHDGSYHKLTVALAKRRDVQLQVRPGYYAPAISAADLSHRLDQAVGSAQEINDLGARIAVATQSAAAGADDIVVSCTMPAKGLPWVKGGDFSREQLSIVAVLRDRNGTQVAGRQWELNYRLGKSSLQSVLKDGLSGEVTFQMPPGGYTLRLVLEESAHGAIAATTRPVVVH